MSELNIKGMCFYGHHGVYAFEKEKGGKYEVDVCIRWNPSSEQLLKDDLSATIDYEIVFAAAKKVMDTPVDLIENLAIRIYTAIHTQIPEDAYLQIKVRKLAPPLGGELAFAEFVWDGA